MASLVRYVLASYFHAHWPLAETGWLITLAGIEASKKKNHLWVSLSLMRHGATETEEEFLMRIAKQTGHIKNYLAQRLRKQLRIQPDLDFRLDRGALQAMRLERLFNGAES